MNPGERIFRMAPSRVEMWRSRSATTFFLLTKDIEEIAARVRHIDMVAASSGRYRASSKASCALGRYRNQRR